MRFLNWLQHNKQLLREVISKMPKFTLTFTQATPKGELSQTWDYPTLDQAKGKMLQLLNAFDSKQVEMTRKRFYGLDGKHACFWRFVISDPKTEYPLNHITFDINEKE